MRIVDLEGSFSQDGMKGVLLRNPSRAEFGKVSIFMNLEERLHGCFANRWSVCGGNRIYILSDKTGCIGFVAFDCKYDEVSIKMVWTHPLFRKRGVGRTLINGVVDALQGADVNDSIWLTGTAESQEGGRWMLHLSSEMKKYWRVLVLTDERDDAERPALRARRGSAWSGRSDGAKRMGPT